QESDKGLAHSRRKFKRYITRGAFLMVFSKNVCLMRPQVLDGLVSRTEICEDGVRICGPNLPRRSQIERRLVAHKSDLNPPRVSQVERISLRRAGIPVSGSESQRQESAIRLLIVSRFSCPSWARTRTLLIPYHFGFRRRSIQSSVCGLDCAITFAVARSGGSHPVSTPSPIGA